MKGIMPVSRFAILDLDRDTDGATSDLIMNEIDTGGSQNGTLILTVNHTDDLSNIEVWTSTRSDFATSTSALSAIASDGLRMVTLASDAKSYDSAFSHGTLGTVYSDITISSGRISTINEDGMYVFTLKNLSRYVNVQFNGHGAGTDLTCVFIGHDLPEGPWQGARSAYT